MSPHSTQSASLLAVTVFFKTLKFVTFSAFPPFVLFLASFIYTECVEPDDGVIVYLKHHQQTNKGETERSEIIVNICKRF